ncbi:MAG TPA: glucose-6-phosphate dehydrogenase assembly protein OpcA [Candidatus Limnocylindrales bacterium]
MATDLIAPSPWSIEPARPGEPIQRWSSRATTIEDIHRELARIWAMPRLTVDVDGSEERHIAARTSVLNFVVVARRPETAIGAADTIRHLTGRHPSRTLIVMPLDPDGPSWLDARITAHCILPRDDAPETCAEMLDVHAGGEAGRHPAAIIAPLLIHDLPVAVWWPGEVPFGQPMASDVFTLADRVVVDGSTWSGDGLWQLAHLAGLLERSGLAVSDFALDRQARWREAIASVFDMPEFLPYLRSLRRVSVTYGTHDETGTPGATNIVKPVYHVAWLASRLGLRVGHPLTAVVGASVGRKPGGGAVVMHGGLVATLRGARDVAVAMRSVRSTAPAGTTLRVELLCDRRGSELRADVTAEAETVRARVWRDGVECLDRIFRAQRKTDVELLTEALEESGRVTVTTDAIRFASLLAGTPRP